MYSVDCIHMDGVMLLWMVTMYVSVCCIAITLMHQAMCMYMQ